MSKSYRKKQYSRREGLYSERVNKDNTPGVHKKGNVWVDDNDQDCEDEDYSDDDEERSVYYDYDDMEVDPGLYTTAGVSVVEFFE